MQTSTFKQNGEENVKGTKLKNNFIVKHPIKFPKQTLSLGHFLFLPIFKVKIFLSRFSL